MGGLKDGGTVVLIAVLFLELFFLRFIWNGRGFAKSVSKSLDVEEEAIRCRLARRCSTSS